MIIIFFFVIFRLLNIDVITIIAFQKVYKRDIIIEQFNKNNNKIIIFIITYVIKIIEFNL